MAKAGVIGLGVMAVGAAPAVELSLRAMPYSVGGLFTDPLIPAEGDVVTITVRATVEGESNGPFLVLADLTLRSADGRTRRSERLQLLPEKDRWKEGSDPNVGPSAIRTVAGSFRWIPRRNGLYTVRAVLDPENRLSKKERGNHEATLELPVVVPGRRPYFPWFGERDHLRWANLWGGGFKAEHLARWRERGVRPLAWKWGANLPGQPTEDDFYRMYLEMGECPGIAIDECGYYPTPAAVERFAVCLRGLARAKKENPDRFFMMWHCGAFYPEQAALYREACDLIVLESYVFYYAPQGLGTDNIYDFLDMKMEPARQVDLLGPTGPQVITSVDLHPQSFHRGELENVIRHLRRRWPEMRGFGIFGGLIPEKATPEQQARAIADEQFVDQLCYQYFVPPVLTFLPGSLWVSRPEDGARRLEASVSNLGGMDSGPVKVGFYVDGERFGEVAVPAVPAGNGRLDNRVLVSVPIPPPGRHELRARIETAEGCTLLDREIEMVLD